MLFSERICTNPVTVHRSFLTNYYSLRLQCNFWCLPRLFWISPALRQKLVENRSRLGASRRCRCSSDHCCFHVVGDNAGRYRRPAACMNPSVCSAKSSLIIYVRFGPAGIDGGVQLGGWVAVFAVPGSLIFPCCPLSTVSNSHSLKWSLTARQGVEV